MTQLIVSLALVLISSSTLAEEKSKTKPLVLPDFSDLNKPTKNKKGVQVQLTVDCQLPSGQLVKRGAPGYDRCMERAATKSIQMKDKMKFKIGN